MIIYIQPEERSLFLEANYIWGLKSQAFMAVEEMSELTKELCKLVNRGFDNKQQIAEEIADVFIVISQLMTSLDTNNEVKLHIKNKIERLKGLVKNG
jgi:NTP pyrophosphatase (non-canonical NTP hydrolase)